MGGNDDDVVHIWADACVRSGSSSRLDGDSGGVTDIVSPNPEQDADDGTPSGSRALVTANSATRRIAVIWRQYLPEGFRRAPDPSTVVVLGEQVHPNSPQIRTRTDRLHRPEYHA
jgi:hypothetical protein